MTVAMPLCFRLELTGGEELDLIEYLK
jgi:hypothetical protein